MIVAGALTAGLELGAHATRRTLVASPVAGVAGGADKSPEPGDGDGEGGGGHKGAHPCNHGFYVSQAAHAHHGGSFVSSVARTDLGKNGDCSAPLPKP